MQHHDRSNDDPSPGPAVDGALTSPLRRAADESLQRQVEGRLRRSIADGRFRPGARVASSRALARELGVARITVQTAYEQLVAEGYLEVDGRRGTRVARDLPERGFTTVSPWIDLEDRALFPRRTAWAPDAPITAPGRATAAAVEMGPEWFGLQAFDTRRWERLLVRAWRELVVEADTPLTTYAGMPGDHRLRAALADHLAVRRGVRCRADDIALTAGSMAAFAAVARTWLGPGSVCVVEDPGGGQLRRALGSAGARIVPVPVDAGGILVDRLPRQAAIAFVTPSWQYPAGGSLSLPRRVALLRWAAEVGAIIVEDDCESELRHDGEPMPSLQGMAPDGRVIYVGTFSKVLYPGLRTGYMVVPQRHHGPLLAALEAGGRAPAAVEQRALALLLEGRGFHRHLQRLRASYAARRASFEDALVATRAGLEVRRATGGGHLILGIVDGSWTATGLAATLADNGIRVEPLAANRLLEAPDDELVVYISRLDATALASAASQIGRIARMGPGAQAPEASRRSTAGRIPPAR